MSIKTRIQKLEQQNGGVVIYITDTFDGDEPVVRSAYVNGDFIERKAGEAQADFMLRTNPRDHPHAFIEHDVELL